MAGNVTIGIGTKIIDNISISKGSFIGAGVLW